MIPAASPSANDGGNAIIRDTVVEDIGDIVRLYRELGLGIMSALSPAIVALYYENIVERKIFVCRTLCHDNMFVGFHVINTDLGISRAFPFYSTPLKSALRIIASPTSLSTMAAYMLSRQRTSNENKRLMLQFESELLYVGVKESCHGRGYGQLLLSDMKQIMARRGIEYLGFEVLKDDINAQIFYKKCSPEIIGETVFRGTHSDVMRINRDNILS